MHVQDTQVVMGPVNTAAVGAHAFSPQLGSPFCDCDTVLAQGLHITQVTSVTHACVIYYTTFVSSITTSWPMYHILSSRQHRPS